MLLTESQLRSIISVLILEGYKDNQRLLIQKHPSHENVLGTMSPKWIEWLIVRYGDSPSIEEDHVFEDAIVTLVKFAERDNSLSTKYRASEAFRAAVDEFIKPNERGWTDWSDPREALKVTVDQMETIMDLAQRKKQNVDVDQAGDIEQDRVGKVGPWNLWMPTSMERSCKIAQYDPITRVPKTTWCTARTAGSNLFYHYVGSQNADIVLFYIIKDNPTADEDWLSVGYRNGKPILNGQRGGLSVKRENSGLTPEMLKSILGSDYGPIMGMLDKKAKDMSGVHPAKEHVRAAARDPALFKKMMKGHSEEENNAMKQMIVGVPDISPDVLDLLADDPGRELAYDVVRNKHVKPETLDKIIDRSLKHHEYHTVNNAADSPNIRPETLRMLAGTLPENFIGTIAKHPNTPTDVLLDISQGNNIYALRSLPFNPNLTTEMIENILNYRNPADIPAIDMLLDKPSITSEQVVKIFNIGGVLRDRALRSPKLPMDMLLDMLDKPISFLTRQAYLNPNVPIETLTRFMESAENDSYKAEMLQNPSMPAHILHHWFDTGKKDTAFMVFLLLNPNLPEDLMMKIAKKAPATYRADLTGNPGVTDTILQILAKDRAERVRSLANIVLTRRRREAMNETLMRVIRRLVR
jgi:hypothetical protein